MSNQQFSDEPVTVKILGDLMKIEAVRNVLQKNFKVLKSTPLYENMSQPGYHTFLTLGEAQQ